MPDMIIPSRRNGIFLALSNYMFRLKSIPNYLNHITIILKRSHYFSLNFFFFTALSFTFLFQAIVLRSPPRDGFSLSQWGEFYLLIIFCFQNPWETSTFSKLFQYFFRVVSVLWLYQRTLWLSYKKISVWIGALLFYFSWLESSY